MKAIGAILLAACAGAPATLDFDLAHWRELHTGSTASLRGLAPVDRSTCWCTGSGGTVLRTRDGGKNWQRITVPGTEGLDLRAVVAFSADVAVVANAGSPARIFRTDDGGENWRMVHEDARPQIFLDAMASGGTRDCWCVGDPLDGAFVLLHSGDGGRSWQPAGGTMPAPGAGEAAFAASNSCLAVRGSSLWLVTGGSACRCLRSSDGGRSFTAMLLPLRSGGESAGAFSVAFTGEHGVAVGGDYRQPEGNDGTAAWTEDGGASWHASDTGALGYRSAVAFVPGGGCIAAGERGCSWSSDGRTWRALPGPGFHALAAARDGSVWAAGGGGRVAVLERSGPP